MVIKIAQSQKNFMSTSFLYGLNTSELAHMGLTQVLVREVKFSNPLSDNLHLQLKTSPDCYIIKHNYQFF